MAEYMDYAEYVADILEPRDLLEQLAEEASELSHAALKLIRAAEMNGNSTPVTKKEAIENLVSEYNDVNVSWKMVLESMNAVNLELITQILNGAQENKKKRWAERLGYGEEQQ